jgi:type IV pilus assembly protein PilN
MIRINLLPVREARRSAALRQQGLLLAGAAILGIVTCVAMQGAIAAQISSERARIVEAKAELKRLEKTLEEVKRFRKEKQAIEAKLAVIEKLERGRQGPVRIMDAIAERIPERLWLKELKLKGGLLELKGASTDNEVVAGFMTSLEESPLLTRVELKETTLSEDKNLKLVEFKISCRDTASLERKKAAGKKKTKKKKRRRR